MYNFGTIVAGKVRSVSHDGSVTLNSRKLQLVMFALSHEDEVFYLINLRIAMEVNFYDLKLSLITILLFH
jgi:hypothetical protein